MPEKIEVIAMMLRLLLFINCGVTRLTNICNNETRRKKDGDLMKMKQNSRKGSDKDVDAFLGGEGAVVRGVEMSGNQLGMLLEGVGGAFRILRWNLRQGGALDWFNFAVLSCSTPPRAPSATPLPSTSPASI
jgi:hypothetical protein